MVIEHVEVFLSTLGLE